MAKKVTKAEGLFLNQVVEFGMKNAVRFDLLLQATQEAAGKLIEMAANDGHYIGSILMLGVLQQLEDVQMTFRKMVDSLRAEERKQSRKRKPKGRKTVKEPAPPRFNLN